MKTPMYLWLSMVCMFAVSQRTLAQENLVGVWSGTARWNHCRGPVTTPALFQLFADGTWNTVPPSTNPYDNLKWAASADGKSFELQNYPVWSHYFTLVKDGVAIGHSGDNKGCFEETRISSGATQPD